MPSLSIKRREYYAQTAEGLRFIAIVRVNQSGMVWRSGKGLVPWENSYNQTVVDFIRSEPIGVNPETVHFDMTVKSERKKSGRYAARFAGTWSASANRKSKKAAKHTKAFRTRNDSFTAEYNNASSLIYGKTIEMNRRPKKVYGKIAEYMDGSGAGKIRGDMRTLEPVFPVPSGRKAR